VRTSCAVLLTKYCSSDQIKENEMGRTCSTYRERCIQDFGGRRKERDHLQGLCVDGMTVKRILQYSVGRA
jgi:hypothetical protein